MLTELYDRIKESVASAKAKYVDSGQVTEEVFDMFIAGDHSRNKKFVEWMLKQYVIDPSRPQHIVDTIMLFNQALRRDKLEKKDIYQYADVDELEDVLSKLELDKPSKTQTKKTIKKDIDIILDNEKVKIVVPLTYEASKLYGANTKWCTAGNTRSYWNDYYDRGSRLYYIIDKVKNVKYAVEVSPSGSKNVYDEKDQAISFDELKKELGF